MQHGDPESSPFDNLMGTRFISMTSDSVVAHLEVTPKLYQPSGILHGGVHCALVEHVASTGAFLWLTESEFHRGRVVGVSNRTDFLKAVTSGVLTATGVPVYRGRTRQVWEVDVVDQAGTLVSRGSVQLVNIVD